MSVAWEKFFKPEIANRGREEFERELVSVSSGSDTQIQAYVRASPLIRVTFVSDSIASPSFTADCSCSSSAKGVLCRHIFATLLQVQKTHPDFLDSKTSVDKASQAATAEPPHKVKQAAYQKQMYAKQKARAKEQRQEIKLKKKGLTAVPKYPEDVAEALAFFNVNGFPMENDIDEALLKNAKKELAWVFHPDKGGSHQESVDLNSHYEVLLRYIGG